MDNKMIDKIKKLLALANSGNENEASSAAEKANKLLIKYNLSMLDVNKEENSYKEEIVGEEPYLRVHQKFILPLMKNHFFIHPMLSQKHYGFTKTGAGKYKTHIVFVGTKENIEIATYTFDFLCSAFQKLWLEYKRQNKLGENKRQHYYNGLVQGLEIKFKLAKKSVESEMGLVVVPDEGLVKHMGQKNLRVHGSRSPHPDEEHAAAGKEKGRSLNINRGLNGKATNSNKMIGR